MKIITNQSKSKTTIVKKIKNLLIFTFLLFSGFLSSACTDSVATFGNNGSAKFVAVKYDYPTTGKSTWFYTFKGATGRGAKDYSHINIGLGTCVTSFSSAGTWTSLTSLTPTTGTTYLWSLKADPSDPAMMYGLKFECSGSCVGTVPTGSTVNVYFTLNTSNIAVGTNTVKVKPGSSFDSAYICGPSSSCSPLPVKLISFNAQSSGNANILNWRTASEINNSHFDVQRSSDFILWETIGQVKGNGTSNIIHTYNFLDPSPFKPQTYYRLKQNDYDGNYEYSPIKMVKSQWSDEKINVFPNPAKESISVSFNSPEQGDRISLSITDVSNRVLVKKIVGCKPNSILNENLYLSELGNGIYYIHIENDFMEKTVKFIKVGGN